MDVLELESAVERRRDELSEAQKVYERTNVEARQIRALRAAEDRLTIAEKELRVARERGFVQQEREQGRLASLSPEGRAFVAAVQKLWPGAELVEVRKHHKGA